MMEMMETVKMERQLDMVYIVELQSLLFIDYTTYF